MHRRGHRLVAAALLTLSASWLASCSSDDGDDACTNCAGSSGSAGRGGGGGGGPVACGTTTCDPLVLPFGFDPVPACCEAEEACGLDATFLEGYGAVFDERCQPRDQPGIADGSCPDSPATLVPDTSLSISLKGCCRTETNTCGYLFDEIANVIEIGLGCVDSGPFLDSGQAPPCGVPGGAGGEGGAAAGASGAAGAN